MPSSSGEALAIEVARLRLAFGDRVVLAGLDVAVGAGEFVSIVGPSGCGKSTLCKVLAGLLVPAAGTARVHGMSAVDSPGLVGYMPQRDLLLPWRRALDNAILGAEIAGVPRAAARERARVQFGRFGLAGFEDAWPAMLSGGMRQRLALLRTFLAEHDVMLLDEPFGALDAITRRDMYEWLQDVWLGDRRSVLFVTHDVEEALYLSDRVLVLTGRPARVQTDIEVPTPRPRDPREVTSAEFTARKATVLDALAAGRGRR